MAELLFRTSKQNYFTISEHNKEGDITFCMYNHAEGAEAVYEEVILSEQDIKLIQEWIQGQQFRFNKTSKKAQ